MVNNVVPTRVKKIEDGEEIKDGAKIIWASVIPNVSDHPRELVTLCSVELADTRVVFKGLTFSVEYTEVAETAAE